MSMYSIREYHKKLSIKCKRVRKGILHLRAYLRSNEGKVTNLTQVYKRDDGVFLRIKYKLCFIAQLMQ